MFALAALFGGANLYAALPPAGVLDFRITGNSNANFLDSASWNEYRPDGGAWTAIVLDSTPWTLSTVGTDKVQLKLDNSVANVNGAFGTSATPINARVYGLFNSTLNINADFHITDEITQDGGSNSTLNISNGANVSVRRIHNLSNLNISGTGTTVSVTDNNDFNNAVKISDGATFKILGGRTANVQGSGTTLFDGATFYGTMETRNDGTLIMKDSTFYAGPNNESIKSGGKMSFTMDNTNYYQYYNAWDTTSSQAARWGSNIVFLGLGGGAEQTFTYKNGTVVHGGGAADGTSFFDMDPGTRTRADITNGGDFMLGWNPLANDTDFLEMNIESGTQVAARSINFVNNNVGDSLKGKITWNQSGTDLGTGYTRVYLGSDVNVRAARVTGSTFASTYNMKGFTLLDAWNINVGQSDMRSGSASFNVTGAYNTIKANELTLGQNGFDGGNSTFSFGGENNVLNLKRIKLSENHERNGVMNGTVTFTAKGTSSANKNVVTIDDTEIILQGSVTTGSTYTTNVSFEGNTSFTRSNGTGVWVKINEWGGKTYTTDSTFSVSGAGNDLLFSGLEIGNGVKENTGKGIFEITGGDSKILIKTDSAAAHNGFRVNDSGLLSYNINDSGISAIVNDSKNDTKFNGQLYVSFLALTNEMYNEEKYILFVTTDMTLEESGRMGDTWFDFSDLDNLVANDDFIYVDVRDGTDSYRFALETTFDAELGKDVQMLVVYYTSDIPEPGTYAVIFGAIALALAIRRRKQN